MKNNVFQLDPVNILTLKLNADAAIFINFPVTAFKLIFAPGFSTAQKTLREERKDYFLQWLNGWWARQGSNL
jgi:hypothetical protein